MPFQAASVSNLTCRADIRAVIAHWDEDDPHGEGNGLSYLAIRTTELWASRTNDRSTATKVGQGRRTTVHATTDERQTWFYWIRALLGDNVNYTPWYPAGATAGIPATTNSAVDTAQAMNGGKILCQSYTDGVTLFNVLLVYARTNAGNPPSPSEPIFVTLLDGAGASYVLKIDVDVYTVIYNGSTLGATANDPTRLWLSVVDNGGSPVYGVTNLSVPGTITGVREFGVTNVVADTPAGIADSSATYAGNVIGANIFNKNYRIVGYADFYAGFATPGNYNINPNFVIQHFLGGPLPGDELASQKVSTTAAVQTTSLIPFDATPPQDTEGALFFTGFISSSPCNFARLRANGPCVNSVQNNMAFCIFWQNSSGSPAQPNAKVTDWVNTPAGNVPTHFAVETIGRIGGTGSISIQFRFGSQVAGTLTINGITGGGFMGNTLASNFEVGVVMG